MLHNICRMARYLGLEEFYDKDHRARKIEAGQVIVGLIKHVVVAFVVKFD